MTRIELNSLKLAMKANRSLDTVEAYEVAKAEFEGVEFEPSEELAELYAKKNAEESELTEKTDPQGTDSQPEPEEPSELEELKAQPKPKKAAKKAAKKSD